MSREIQRIIDDAKRKRISRREFLRAASFFGVGVVSASTLNRVGALEAAFGTNGIMPNQQITGNIEFWCRETFSNGVRIPLINARLKEFDGKNPGTTSKAQFQILNESIQKTQASLQAGSPPDLGQYGPSVSIGYAAAQHLLPLDDIYAELKDRLIPLEKENFTQYQGKTYGVPWYAESRVLIYHKDLLEQAGVQPPKTWDEWKSVAKKLTSGDRFGMIYPMDGATAGHFWVPLGYSIGGEVLDKDGNIKINSEPFKVALEFAASFIKEKLMPEATPTYKLAEAVKLFQLKQAAMIVRNGQAIEDLRGVDPKLAEGVGAVLIPVRKEGDISRSFLGGFNLCIFAKAPNKDGAKALLRFLFEEPWYTDYMKGTSGAALPVLKTSLADPFFKTPILDTLLKQLSTAISHSGPAFGNAPFMFTAQQLFSDALVNVVVGKSNIEDAIKKLETELQKLKAAAG